MMICLAKKMLKRAKIPRALYRGDSVIRGWTKWKCLLGEKNQPSNLVFEGLFLLFLWAVVQYLSQTFPWDLNAFVLLTVCCGYSEERCCDLCVVVPVSHLQPLATPSWASHHRNLLGPSGMVAFGMLEWWCKLKWMRRSAQTHHWWC